MGSRGAPKRTPEYHTIGYLEAVYDPPRVSHTGNAQSEIRHAPSRSSSSSSSTGSGKSAAGGAAEYKEPSNYSIYKGYGGQQNFLHSHGLRMWNPEDVDEGKRIVAEIKSEMREQHEAAQAAAKPTRRSNTDWMFKD